MPKMKKRSFFERLTGGIRLSEDELPEEQSKQIFVEHEEESHPQDEQWMEQEQEGELSLDLYQTESEIIVQTFVAGVKPEDLEINITRDMLTIRGRREENRKTVHSDDYFTQELYWGAFSRAVSLPQEVEPEEAEAIERHGLLTVRLPKIDKHKKNTVKVKSV